MDKKVLLLIVLLFAFACKKENNQVCFVNDPASELTWLAKIITLAELDSVGNYHGTIYLEYYQGNPVFYTDMKMESGGVIGHWFNCDGSNFTIDDQGEFLNFANNMKKNKIIFSNVMIE